MRTIDCTSAAVDDPRLAEALSCLVERYLEIRLDGEGSTEQPVFLPIEPRVSSNAVITSDDVVVVVGGAKGIAAECALRIARGGAAIVLVGRSRANDPQVAATLDRAKRSGARCRYVRADVLDGRKLARALAPAIRQFGPATTLVFAPAINEPRRLTDLDAETVRRTFTPKVVGLQQALGVLGPTLRRLISFGSIIGRIGLEGNHALAAAQSAQRVGSERRRRAGGRMDSVVASAWVSASGPSNGRRTGRGCDLGGRRA